MAVREDDLEEGAETAEQIAQREATEREEQRAAELAEAQKARYEAELKQARAEGEAEALKKTIPPPAAASQWTEEQWAAAAAEHETSVKALKLQVSLAQGAREEAKAAMKGEVDAAKEEARLAREEAKRARASGSLYEVEQQFYKENPGLVGRKGDVKEFLDLLPPETREDPEKLSKALDKAKVYVIGKAKESVGNRRRSSHRDEGFLPNDRSDEEEENLEGDGPETKLDFKGLENEGQKLTLARIARDLDRSGVARAKKPKDLSKPLHEMERSEAFKACETSDEMGVAIDETADWEAGSKMNRRPPARLGER